jgi:hypothetical protein
VAVILEVNSQRESVFWARLGVAHHRAVMASPGRALSRRLGAAASSYVASHGDFEQNREEEIGIR